MQRQEGFLFGCAFHAWLYSCKLKRCGNSCLLSFRQRLEVLTLKYHQDKMIKLHRFGLESQNKRISWAGKHKDHRAQLLDVQIGLGWKEPDFQIWQTGSTGCSASWKFGVLSWAFPGTFGLLSSFRFQGVEEKEMLKCPERYLEDGISYPKGKLKLHYRSLRQRLWRIFMGFKNLNLTLHSLNLE